MSSTTMPRRFTRIPGSLGDMIMVATGSTAPADHQGADRHGFREPTGSGTDALMGVYFADQRHVPAAEQLGSEVTLAEDPFLQTVAEQLREYFDGTRHEFDVPLAPEGSDFELRVWEQLRAIPHGTTTSYGQLARQLDTPGGAQGVGQAVGHNPISVIVPCHRVVAADGSLTGYAGGLQRKRALLDLETPASQRLL